MSGLKLRARLAVTGLALAIPVMAAVVWGRHQFQWRSAQTSLIEAARARVSQSGREVCDGERREWPPSPTEMVMRPGGASLGRLVAYDAAGRALDGVELPLLPELQQAVGRGQDEAVAAGDFGGRPIVQALVRAPSPGLRCAYLAFVRPRPAELPTNNFPVAPLLGAFIVVGTFLSALGPVVRRIRRLTLAVRRSEQGSWLEPVPVEGKDEIAELAAAFNAASAEVRTQVELQQRREKALRDFLANTTHDVAIPLTVLQGRLANMRGAFADGAVVSEELVRHAIEDAHHLGALIHNLGAAAKLQAGEPEIVRVPLDLRGVVQRCVARHQPLAELIGVDLQAAVPADEVSFVGDPTLLEQAVGNLIYNAVHYNQRGGHVAVVLDALRGGRFRLMVVDDGPGIEAAELTQLFERNFRSTKARLRRPEGRGLGLDIVKRVADVHELALRPELPEEGGLRMVFEGALAGAARALPAPPG